MLCELTLNVRIRVGTFMYGFKSSSEVGATKKLEVTAEYSRPTFFLNVQEFAMLRHMIEIFSWLSSPTALKALD